MELDEVNARVNRCTDCSLHAGATQPVPGSGDPHADVLLVGEAPGRWEDIKGKPFVGRAGKLLDEALARAGLGRGEIYITNVLKCRPPNNRRPAREEIEACTPLLNKQIEVISPRIIVTLGATAGEVVFRKYGFKWEGMLKENARPRVINTVFGSVTLLPAIHPAAVLRNPNWQRSLDAAMEKLAEIRK